MDLTPEIKKLKAAYEKQKPTLSVEQLAALTGLHRTTIFGVFRGAPTTIHTVEKLSRALGLSLKFKIGKGRVA